MESKYLNIEKLGGYQQFEIINQKESQKSKYRYVCSTWEGDGMDNNGNYDIFCDKITSDYVCLPA